MRTVLEADALLKRARLGDPTLILFGSRVEESGRFAIAEARDLVPSHQWDGLQPDSRYPSSMQGRGYSGRFGKTAGEIVALQVLDPLYVLDLTQFAWGGPPICLPSGIVVAGNHRAILLQAAALREDARHTSAYAAYRQILFSKASYWGIDARAIDELKKPVLVRVLDAASAAATDESGAAAVRLNVLSDRPPTKAYDPLSDGFAMAMSLRDARGRVSAEAVSFLCDIIGDAPLSTALRHRRGYGLLPELTRFGVVTVAEHPAFIESHGGRMSKGGRARITWMVRALVTNDRGVLASAPVWVLERLDGCWALLLVEANSSVGDIMRARISETLRFLSAVDAAPTTVEADKLLNQAQPPCAVLLAKCLRRLSAKRLPAVVGQWLQTLDSTGGGGGDEVTHADLFSVASLPAASVNGPGAVLDDVSGAGAGTAVAGREREFLETTVDALQGRAPNVGGAPRLPDEYLSATEWSQLDTMMPAESDRVPSVRGGRPVASNRALAAGLVRAFERGATPTTLLAKWAQLLQPWFDQRLICRRTTLQRRLARFDAMPGGRGAILAVVESLARRRRHDVKDKVKRKVKRNVKRDVRID